MGYEELGYAIVLQAIRDYKAALSRQIYLLDKMKIADVIKDCEEFFRSDWFAELYSGIGGEELMQRIRDEVGYEDSYTA